MKNITFEFKHASKVTKDERAYLKGLQIQDIGLIWGDFLSRHKHKRCFVALAKNTRGHTIGWSLLYYDPDQAEWVFAVFVKPSYRRKGIGKKLYRLTKRKKKLKDRKLRVFRHDTTSTRFYDYVQK